MTHFAADHGLAPVVNLSGPLTIYGTSISSPAVAAATAEALAHHWDMDTLYQRSGELIARWSGAEAAVLTSSSASGITLAVAACMTGSDPGRIRQLPDPAGMKHEVVIQQGHAVNFGAPIEQMIRLAGAQVCTAGTVNQTSAAEVEHLIGPQTAAAVFVISHHAVPYGSVPLPAFISLCHRHGVPVIIDGAAQDHQIQRMTGSGADLTVISVQKYLAGPTGGIVCGTKALVKAVYLQNRGIGRTMKIGKEGIFGTMAAIEERMATDLDDWATAQGETASSLAERLINPPGLPGLAVSLERDRVGQPVTRVRLEVDPAVAGQTAADLCRRLEQCSPSIKPRAHHVDEGWFLLEPVGVTAAELDYVAEQLHTIVATPEQDDTASRKPGDAFLRWLS